MMVALKGTYVLVVLAFISVFCINSVIISISHGQRKIEILETNYAFVAPFGDGMVESAWTAPPQFEANASLESSILPVKIVNQDDDCIFRHSPLYRSIFVYPSPGEPLFEIFKSEQAGLSKNGTIEKWPWLEMNEDFREKKFLLYNIEQNDMNHFAIEQYVHDIMTHPKSCLRTNNPEEAKLFYVPILETLYWQGLHKLGQFPKEWLNRRVTPYGKALLEAIEGNYDLWEDRFGLTSQYWKRKGGADHFFVMAEPCNGLWHIPGARGHKNYVGTQRQNRPPIIISQELSAAYVEMYPKCAAKNIVMPYANIHGKWFRGYFEQEALAHHSKFGSNHNSSSGDRKLTNGNANTRPILVHYSAGSHGQCAGLRNALNHNHRCSKSYSILEKHGRISRPVQMHLSKFCPCPAGDSPSARRMNDAVVAGCIPVILSKDYVWPLSKEVDHTSDIDPSTFSIRLNFSDFGRRLFDDKECRRIDGNVTLEEYLETIPDSEVRRLQLGMKKIAPLFEYYKRRNMSDTPLSDRLLPDGGASHAFVHELAKRAAENRWQQCQEELKLPHPREPQSNPC